ncbi:PadR family transcriptional regulator [Phycicoccus endophyticus]|uniref:PadR family transcriptional regulator n=1 Tax=Phycicoccus endophyticus TaxID=1690220 RepID=A0A7G9R644_9MICO|nr:PadR family transcriptional regulator [Phycicoccus endophyticus]NHI20139.1 PadR family transcriptional regulator [Phycicoccus endophyticus]QNN51069.1 PadR family transcriptional regulator [Phycicoccus endophyticus]GGL38083.1 transcriptional regulator [Phycicoccus endophyticus]
MSVRLGLMALLAEGESYGARLRAAFEERTGGTWPLNVGQVYTTLERLVRDGLVAQSGQADAEGRIAYRLTDAGRGELAQWWVTPVDRTSTPRDELTIKLALAVTAPGVDVHGVVQGQRTAALRHLRDLTRLKRDALDAVEGRVEGARDAEHGLAWLLVLENLVFAAEAEVRWLDHVESVLARQARTPRPARGPEPATSEHTTGERPVHWEGKIR